MSQLKAGDAESMRFLIENVSAGAVMSVTLHKRGGREWSIEFPATFRAHTRMWELWVNAWRSFVYAVPPLSMLGFTAFFLPKRLRIWVVSVAATSALASLLDPDPTKWLAPSGLVIGQLVSLLIASIAFVLPVRQRSMRFCRKCNYDLTGNESGICPECGTPRPLANLDTLASNLDAIE